MTTEFAPPGRPPPPFAGKFDPYIDTAELADLLNFAGAGASAWTTDKVRALLASKPNAAEPSPFPDRKRRKEGSSKARLVTTRTLLRDHLPHVYYYLLQRLSPPPGGSAVEAILPASIADDQE